MARQYVVSDLRLLSLSYFRRTVPAEREFHVCNLRKSPGYALVAQGADPIPSVEDVRSPYSLRLTKFRGLIEFFVNELQVLRWTDDGVETGPILGSGKIGFRQMANLIAEYSNFSVTALESA